MIASDRCALEDEARARIEALMQFRRRALCAGALYREVSLQQLHILMALQELGSMTVSELAGRLGISMPSASSILDRMAEHGLVERVRDLDDRRVVRVALSTRGRTTVEEFIGPKREQMQRLLGAMTDDELQAVIDGIVAVQRAVARLGSEDASLAAS